MYLIANVMMMICNTSVEGVSPPNGDDTCGKGVLSCVGKVIPWREFWNVVSRETTTSNTDVLARVGPKALQMDDASEPTTLSNERDSAVLGSSLQDKHEAMARGLSTIQLPRDDALLTDIWAGSDSLIEPPLWTAISVDDLRVMLQYKRKSDRANGGSSTVYFNGQSAFRLESCVDHAPNPGMPLAWHGCKWNAEMIRGQASELQKLKEMKEADAAVPIPNIMNIFLVDCWVKSETQTGVFIAVNKHIWNDEEVKSQAPQQTDGDGTWFHVAILITKMERVETGLEEFLSDSDLGAEYLQARGIDASYDRKPSNSGYTLQTTPVGYTFPDGSLRKPVRQPQNAMGLFMKTVFFDWGVVGTDQGWKVKRSN